MKRALVLILVLVAACGGGSGKASAKAAYLSKAEAVCVNANAKVAAAKKAQPTAIAQIPPYVHQLLDLAKQTLDELSLLTPPAGDTAQIKAKVLDPLGKQYADGQAFAAKVDAAAAAKDTQQLTSLVFNPPTKTRADLTWMKKYGFKACVTSADTGGTAK